MAVDLEAMTVVERNREARKAALIRTAQPIAKSIVDGKVRVYHFLEGKWKTLHPIDAREQVGMGLAALEVIDMLDPKGQPVKVDAANVESYRGSGYRYLGEAAPESKPANQTAAKPTLEELRKKAAAMGVLNAAKLKEPELSQMISEIEAKAEADPK